MLVITAIAIGTGSPDWKDCIPSDRKNAILRIVKKLEITEIPRKIIRPRRGSNMQMIHVGIWTTGCRNQGESVRRVTVFGVPIKRITTASTIAEIAIVGLSFAPWTLPIPTIPIADKTTKKGYTENSGRTKTITTSRIIAARANSEPFRDEPRRFKYTEKITTDKYRKNFR